MAFYCYMVECANGALYTGWTTDPIRREKEHNAGRGARYTRMNGPVRLVYVEEMLNRIEAQKRELQIKGMNPIYKRRLIDAEGNIIATLIEVKPSSGIEQKVELVNSSRANDE